MRSWSRAWPLALLAALAPACSGGGGDDQPAAPDAAPDAAPACGEVAPGDAFELRFGVTGESGDFDELLDGEECPIRLGNQGILMLIGELRAPMADPAPNSICCTAAVSPTGDFAGKTDTERWPIYDHGDELGAPTLTLLGGREYYDTLDGATVTVTWSCAGDDGAAGSVTRSVQFYVQ